jgi:hypothetical protein
MGYRLLLAGSVAWMTALGAPAPARGMPALAPCQVSTDPNSYKILLDDITTPDGSASPEMTALRFEIERSIQQLKTDTALPVTVVRCPQRLPQDPADFSKALAQSLNTQRVVLEIWGTMTRGAAAPGAAGNAAAVGYALIPIRFYEFTSGQPPAAFLRERPASSGESAGSVLKFVDGGGELLAYTSLAAGARLLRSLEFDAARTHLCNAVGLLATPRPGPPDATRAALLDYARRQAKTSVVQALADTSYDGPLRTLRVNPDAECSTTRQP